MWVWNNDVNEVEHIGVCLQRSEFKAFAHYELINISFYDCSCLEYCFFPRLVVNRFVYSCLNSSNLWIEILVVM